jgi:HEAT repeat protein
MEPLFSALRHDRQEDVREAAAKALGEIREAAAVDPLVAALRDRNERVRQAAAKSLGQIGNIRAVEPLIDALEDPRERSGRVRQELQLALERLGTDMSLE